jgi:hypothetical protein
MFAQSLTDQFICLMLFGLSVFVKIQGSFGEGHSIAGWFKHFLFFTFATLIPSCSLRAPTLELLVSSAIFKGKWAGSTCLESFL